MSGKRYAGLTVLFILLTLSMTGVVHAQTDTSSTIVEGVVFEDLTNDLIHDEGEPGVSGAALEFLDGSERLIQAQTVEDGSFLLQLEPGLWRVLVHPPSGFVIADSAGLEFLIEDDTNSVRLDIALTRIGEADGETQENETVDDEVSEDATDLEEDDTESQATEPQDDDDAELDDDNGGYDGGFYLLPESGGNVPSRWIGLLISFGLTAASIMLLSIGRSLRADHKSSHGKS